MSNRLLAYSVFAAAVSASAVALAAFAQKPGTETWTDASGVAGSSHTDLLTSADYFGLQVFQVHEFEHRPCVIEVDESTFATRDKTRLDPLKICEPKGGESWKTADIGSGKYVTGIAVCTASKDDPIIHGVELWGGSLSDNGTPKPAKAPVTAKFPECKKWAEKRSCPAGTVATGLRGYYDEAEKGLVGLALRCHALVERGQ